MTEFFEANIKVRLTLLERQKVGDVLALNRDKFDSLSHYVRCAINHFTRYHESRSQKKSEGVGKNGRNTIRREQVC